MQIYYLVLENSVDSRIAEVIVSKMDMMTKVLDGKQSLEKF